MKLEGIRVIDLSVFLPGPYLTLALADHGAEVLKIEAPGGEPTRSIGLADGPSTVYFRTLNRGKKSVVVDLKTDAGRDALLRLCRSADVFVESFRPGVVDRLGIGYDAVRAVNPQIVYCSISAFGQEGPYRDRPAHELGVEAVAGLLGITLGNDDQPAMPGIPVGDILAGLQGLAGVLMALLRRERTGAGDYLDLSLHDSTLGALQNTLGPALAEARQPVPRGERSNGGAALYRVYETSDGRHIALAGLEEKFVVNLLTALGRPDLIALCKRPGAQQQPVMDFLAHTFRQKTRDEWDAWLAPLDVCYGAVKTMPEALADSNARARGMVFEDEGGRTHLANPIRFRYEPAQPSLHEPTLGEHTDSELTRS